MASQEVEAALLSFIHSIPKAELHVHVEGTFEPQLMFEIAKRNGIKLEGTVESHLQRRASFKDLQDFLDMYYEACNVLKEERDFYDLMYAYLKRAACDGVRYAEIFFDPQTHTERGVPLETVINGLFRAIVDGQKNFCIRARLIMCFLRHMSEESALETLMQAKPHVDKIIGVGLDSGELNNPPSMFRKVFKEAQTLGLKLVAHAGEEGGPDYIVEALDLLHAQRIDHGVQCLKDRALVERLAKEGTPLTVCPMSNWKLKVNQRFLGDQNRTRELLSKGIVVTVNSDDPAYFGGYIVDNFVTAVNDTGLTKEEIFTLCQNSFKASFLLPQDKELYLEELKDFGVGMGLLPIPKAVAICGAHSIKEGSEEYEFARALGRLLVEKGYTILNGGYSGSMEASAKGAQEGGGGVVGVISPGVFTNRLKSLMGNEYIHDVRVTHTTFDRSAKLLLSALHIIVLPGSTGTTAEFLHSWYQADVGGIRGSHTPKILLVRDPWESIINVLRVPLMMEKAHPSTMNHIIYFDTPQEAVDIIDTDRKERLHQID
jgi:adenosine deaminase